jgi:hypothetical protein
MNFDNYPGYVRKGPGRPQGSPPLIHSTLALTMTTNQAFRLAFIVRAGAVGRMGGDPCGRPRPFRCCQITLSKLMIASLQTI